MIEKNQSEESDLSDLISISEAARVRGVSHTAIQDLIKRGKLSAVEVGGRRLVSRREVESFEPEPVGRPSKAKAEIETKGSKKKVSKK